MFKFIKTSDKVTCKNWVHTVRKDIKISSLQKWSANNLFNQVKLWHMANTKQWCLLFIKKFPYELPYLQLFSMRHQLVILPVEWSHSM